MHTYITPVIH